MGSNGLPPGQRPLRCEATPDKALYRSLQAAEAGAARSSERFHVTVVPYACASCGYFHLTHNAHKSDVVNRDGAGRLVTHASKLRDELKAQPPVRRAEPVDLEKYGDYTVAALAEVMAKRGFRLVIQANPLD